MLKAGLIAGAVMFFAVLITAVFSPLCALCVPILVGLGAGYLNGVFEKNTETAVQRGAYAGAIAGGLGILGQLIASVINAVVLQNPNNQINDALGLPIADPGMVWVSQLGVACCIGLVNVALSAGLGAGGGAIWKNTAGKTTPPSDMTPA
jgi:MFS family permease